MAWSQPSTDWKLRAIRQRKEKKKKKPLLFLNWYVKWNQLPHPSSILRSTAVCSHKTSPQKVQRNIIIIAPRWKQAKYSPTDKRTNNHRLATQCITMGKCKRNKVLILITTWINLDAIMKQANQVSHRSLHVVWLCLHGMSFIYKL